MDFQKSTPKWFLIAYALLLTFQGVLSISLLLRNLKSSGFIVWYMLIFMLFSILMAGFFLAKKYELRSWAAPLAYLVFGFVTISLLNNFTGVVSYAGFYFLNFIKTIFFWLFILLVDILYLHPHVKHIPEKKKKYKKKENKEEVSQE
jgi:small-conductance mechanosensitive channel